MNLSNAAYHDLVYDSKALYRHYRIERRRAMAQVRHYDEKIKDYWRRHKIQGGQRT